MSYSSGRTSHHHLLLFTTTSFLLFFFFLLTSAAGDHDDGGGGAATAVITIPSSSREEMVQLAGYGEEKLSTVLVTGSLVCQSCSLDPRRASNSSDNHNRDEQLYDEWPVPGAVVAVNCRTRGSPRRPASAQTVTDEFGDFVIDLPSELHGIPEMDKTCCVKVLRMPKKSTCRPAYVQKHKGLELSSVGNGIRNYSAGKIELLHSDSKPLQACSKIRHNVEAEIAV